jgi:hypothetical protein
MSADGERQDRRREALAMVTEARRSEGSTFAPALTPAHANATSTAAAGSLGQVASTLQVATQSGKASYVERLRLKAAAKERARAAKIASDEAAELALCTFAPDLPACPAFILRLADGFKEQGSLTAAKRRHDLYGHSGRDPYGGNGSGGEVVPVGPTGHGAVNSGGCGPGWQTVGVSDGTVHGSRWRGVHVTDPSLHLHRGRRSSDSVDRRRADWPEGRPDVGEGWAEGNALMFEGCGDSAMSADSSRRALLHGAFVA